MTARKLATPTNAELDANPERLRIVAKSNVEKAFYEADSKERLTACLNTTTIRVLAAMLGELTGKSYDPNEACKEYWVARVAEYFIHIRKVRLHEKFRTHSISEIQDNSAFAMLQDLVSGKGYTQAYAILCASTAKDLKTMCKAFNLKNVSRLNQKKIYARLLVDFADEYWLLYSDFDNRNNDSQPELPATADDAISSNDNDNALASQPAEIANVQSEDTAQPEAATADIAQTVKYAFIPGKVYAYRFSCSVDPFYCKITAKTDKTICYVKYNCDEITRAKLRSDNRGEYFYVGKSALVHADDLADAEIASRLFECTENTPNPHDNNTPAEIAQPDALYMDDSFSDAPGDNSCPDQDIPEYREPETIPTDNNPLHHLKPCPNCRSTHIPFLKRCDDNNFSTATRRFNGGIARQHIYYRLKCRDCGHEVKATIYRTGLGRFVIPHQNEADVKNEVCQAWNKQYDDNPGITIVPSDEIEKPDYTVYPEPIIDECPYVTVSACDIPENHSHAAVVPYNQASGIRCFLRLIAIYIRLWLASNITPDNDAIRSFVSAPWLVELEIFAPGNPNDFSPLIYKWRRKDFSEKLKLCRSQIATCKTREEIIAALQGISSESIRLLCVADRVFDKFTRIAAPECERKLAYARRYADKIIQRREKAMTIKAEVKDITAQQPHVKLKKKYTVNPSPRIEVRPEAAPADIEHKLIETKDLHFSDKRKALDHNAAVITSCMFSEAVISLLSSISLQAILQLGFHMRLFIAKPKGKKNVVADLFAKRLIEYRELRANVRSTSDNITANNSASVPDGVKFFETKHRQLGFIFTE